MAKRRADYGGDDSGYGMMLAASCSSSSCASDANNSSSMSIFSSSDAYALNTPPGCKYRRQELRDSALGASTSFISTPPLSAAGHFTGPSTSPSLSTPKNILNRSGGKGMTAYLDAVPMSPIRYLGGLSPGEPLFGHHHHLHDERTTTVHCRSPSSSGHLPRQSPLTLSNKVNAVEYRFSGSQLSSFCTTGGMVPMGSPETESLKSRQTRLISSSENVAVQPLSTTSQQQSTRSTNRCLMMGDQRHEPYNSETTTGQCSSTFSTSTPVQRYLQSSEMPQIFVTDTSDSRPQRPHFGCSSTTPPMAVSMGSSTGGSVTFDSNVQPVLPSSMSPLRLNASQNAASRGTKFPRTPTPFKKALAAIEQRQGRLQPVHIVDDPQQQQVVQDIRDIISSDFQRAETPPATAHQPFVTEEEVKQEEPCSSSYGGDDSGLSLTLPYGHQNADDSHQYFRPPRHEPKPFSKRWMRYCCGRTKRQLEMTRLAREFLRLPPSICNDFPGQF